MSGIISEAQAQLGFIPHFIHIRFLKPSGHPPLLSTVLAPGWVTHAKKKGFNEGQIKSKKE